MPVFKKSQFSKGEIMSIGDCISIASIAFFVGFACASITLWLFKTTENEIEYLEELRESLQTNPFSEEKKEE